MNVLKSCFLICLMIPLGWDHTPSIMAQESVESERTSFTLWQLPSRTGSQNMSYVMRTVNGKIIVVDGGYTGDAEYLSGFLAPLGNQVHAWFISHPHLDHVDALTEILNKNKSLQIDEIYGSLPEESWIAQHEPQHVKTIQQLNAALLKHKRNVTEVSLGQHLEIDGVQIDILGIKNPEITPNAINNTSIVFRLYDETKSILFTGDLGVQGGNKLLNSPYRDQLKSDYVQMAHHGQNGVTEEFYQVVSPKYCLWPTPAWLWNNDSGKGINSGTWQTLIVRDWMDKLKVEKHYLSAEGLIQID